jgi:hypothetical protein
VSRVEAIMDPSDERPSAPSLPFHLLLPVVIAIGAVVIVIALIVRAAPSAWELLGAGRGAVPPEYYPLSAFVLVVATTLGQAVGWAGGTGILYYVLTRVGQPPGDRTWRVAMSAVYVGLGTLPLFVYHVLFGGPLLGVPRTGLEEWLARAHPDAHWLLVTVHPYIDFSVAPLTVIFLGLLWGLGEAMRRTVVVRTVLALALLGTSAAIALSLAIHSTLVHVRLM